MVLVWDGEGCQVVTASSKKEGDSYCMMVKNGCKVHQQEGSREGDSHCMMLDENPPLPNPVSL